MRFLSYLTTLLIAVLLAACGGGGGSAGTVAGGPTPLAMFSTVPDGLTLVAGSNGNFSIGGGVAPFSAVSNNTAVVNAAVSGTALIIGGVSPGTATVTIRDSVGTALTVTVNVNTGSTRPLFTTAPASITLTPGLLGAQTYLVGGGAKPYLTPSSSNAAVASVTLSADGSLTLTGLASGTSNITIMDSLGATLTLAVTVPTVPTVPLFTTAPSPVTLAIGSSTQYAVGGGSLPYTSATSSNTGVAVATLGTNSVTIDALAAGNANVVVRDNAGGTTTIQVIVSTAATTPLFSTAPSPITVAIGTSPQYTVGGGTPPYTVTSSNLSVSTVTQNTATHVITINGLSAGSAVVAVRDGAGTVLPISVTVPPASAVPLFTTAPANVTVAVGAHPQFDIGGGTGPYSASSSNVSFVTASVQNSTKLQIDGIAAGSASVVVRDSLGASVPITVTVPPATTLPLFTTAPSTGITVLISADAQLTIGGGSGTGYTATSNNLGVATVTAVDPTTHVATVHGVATGDAVIVVRDSAGATVSVSVHVPPAGSVALFTNAPSSVTLDANTTRTFTIGGGSGVYTATSSNTSNVSASVSGSTLSIGGIKSGGSATVVVGDSIGSTPVSIQVTVAAAPLAVNPSAATALVGDTLVSTISGGKAPYSAVVSNTLVASASITNTTTLTIHVNQPGTNVPIVIFDSNGASTSFQLTSTAAGTVIQLSPSALTISEQSTGTFTLSVLGAVGSVSAFSSDTALLKVVSATNTVLTIDTGTNGSRCIVPATPGGTVVVKITAIDSTGAVAVSSVTIQDSVATCTTPP
jgi:hypothetical protein